MNRNRMRGWMALALAGSAVVLCAVQAPVALAAPSPAPHAFADEAEDVLLMTNGQELKGKILSETATSIKFRLTIAGITTDVEYPRSQIKEVRRGKSGDAPKPGTPAPSTPTPTPTPAAPESPKADAAQDVAADGTADTGSASDIVPLDGRTRYYYADLKGRFGENITQMMIRRLLKDAQKQQADVLIFNLDATWRMRGGDDDGKDAPDDTASFDAIFRAEEVLPILVEEMPREWDKAPKVVFWVKNAMGGAAMLPLSCPNIYMHPDGRIGGLGDLSFLFGSTGDEVVRQKQKSLRLGHAEGWMIKGGYDPRLMRAMAQIEYVLSARIEGDKVTLFEGYPETPSDELLTDDGDKGNVDTLQQRVAGETNDVLTLKPRIAQAVGVSKGTVETRDDLLSALGLTSNAVDVSTKSKKITDGWNDELRRTKKQLVDLWREYREVRVQPPGEWQQRTAARGKRRGILKQMKPILERYNEALTPPFFGQNEFPQQSGDKMVEWITYADEQLWIEQQKDKK